MQRKIDSLLFEWVVRWQLQFTQDRCQGEFTTKSTKDTKNGTR